ncbi:MAG TPA: bacteriohemerythrin [Alphaproteobacteria bacterium]|jgi:hemerythrin-like metal-binding protein|nr:bacteriohemerythrin [Alphaproteobacteria bacterium]
MIGILKNKPVPAAEQGAQDPFLPWSEKYSVGVETVDNDHHRLFELINEFHAALGSGQAPRVVKTTLQELADYVRQHFEREEEVMTAARYPDLARHKEMHARLRRAVEATQMSYDVAARMFDFQSFLGFLQSWLTNHILVEDRKFAEFSKKT